jgi:predicted enzyme related to lactoylglutathione lyase
MSHHPFVHIEISANDRVAAAKFYNDLFGWEAQQFPEMSYATFETGDGPGGGFNPVTPENPAGTVTPYVNADDIHATLKKAEALGGTVAMPVMEVPGTGLIAVFKDPTGNLIGLLQSAGPQPDHDHSHIAHPFNHIELSANDRQAAGQFYSELFGWKIQQMPEMNYAMVETGDGLGAGLNPVTKDNPAGTTLVYVYADDLPGTLAKASSLGATPITSETEIPGYGWWAAFRDPTGNTIGLFKPNM